MRARGGRCTSATTSDGRHGVPARAGHPHRAYFERRRRPWSAPWPARRRWSPTAAGPCRARRTGSAALRGKVLGRAEGMRQPEGLRAVLGVRRGPLGPRSPPSPSGCTSRPGEAGARAFLPDARGRADVRLVNAAGPACRVGGGAAVALAPGVRPRDDRGGHARGAGGAVPPAPAHPARVRHPGPDLEDLADLAERPLAGRRRLRRRGDRRDRVRARLQPGGRPPRRSCAGGSCATRSLRPPGRSAAVVDLGWGATIQSMAQRLLREAGIPCRTLGLYMVTGEKAAQRRWTGWTRTASWLRSDCPRTRCSLMRSPEVLEQLCMPDHGSQVSSPRSSSRCWRRRPRSSPSRASSGRPCSRGPGLPARVEPLPPRPARDAGAAVALPARAAAGHHRARRGGADPRRGGAVRGWLHDENFGSDRGRHRHGLGKALPHLDPRTLIDIPMTELYWPFGLAALHDEHLARPPRWPPAGSLGGVRAGARDGALRGLLRPGLGILRTPSRLVVRRNRRGLSLAAPPSAATSSSACAWTRPARRVVRLDWISPALPATGARRRWTLESPRGLRAPALPRRPRGGAQAARRRGRPLILSTSSVARAGPVLARAGCAFAVLGLPRSQARERRARFAPRCAASPRARDWARRCAWLGVCCAVWRAETPLQRQLGNQRAGHPR